MKILLTGSSGLVGASLIEYLFKKSYTIHCLKRLPGSLSDPNWDTANLPQSDDSTYDAVIHLAGENVASGRWTQSKKTKILESRVAGTKNLVRYISQLPVKPKVFLCASAIGFYGSSFSERFTESDSVGTGFLAEVCQEWEQVTLPLKDLGIRIVNLRFGMILSPRGGALHKMLPAFKLRTGGVIGNGKQYMSWVSIRDVVAIIEFLMRENSVEGPVNIVSPNAVTNKVFTKTLGKSLDVPTFFPVPSFVVKTIFGQMGEEMLLGSSNIEPKKLRQAGYSFRDEDLEDTLAYCING